MSNWIRAFSLSKQEVVDAQPPGTSKLVGHTAAENLSNAASDQVLLVPRPSCSPKDPLNWPTWRKIAILISMSYYAAVADFMSAVVTPALPLMQPEMSPPQSFGNLTHLTAVSVFVMGASSIIWVPISNVFGRRVVLVIAPLIMTLCSMWCGLAGSNFGSLLAARAVQGFGGGPADTISPNVVGEVFFLHQHGRVMAVYTLFLAGGSAVGGVAGGYIAGNLGYKYLFWISTALSGAVFLMNLFLVPETLFDREEYYYMEADVTQQTQTKEEEAAMNKGITAEIESVRPSSSSCSPTPMSFIQSLKLGVVYRGGLFKQLIAPWLTLRLPATWMVMLHYGGLLGGFVSMSTVAPQVLSELPYKWGNNVGLFSLSAIVGIGLGAVATYGVADRLTLAKAKHEAHGLSEPEDRLPSLFPALFLATFGLLVFGLCAQNPSPHAWGGLVVGSGMLSFGMAQIPSIGFNYLIESYAPVSADCLVMVTLLRAVISFAWTFFVGDWVASDGAALPFGIFMMLMGVFSLYTIPIWLFGKRFRIATTEYFPEFMVASINCWALAV